MFFASESFLKALYIEENNIQGNKIDEIWEKLKRPEKIDPTRNKKKIKGHDLDILIDNLTLDSKRLLETRMMTIGMNVTDKYNQITIYDLLLKNELIKKINVIEIEKYHSWVEHHKRTFEKSRYGGEEYHKVNIEFLYHLAIQIRAVAQYKICPTDDQIFLLECNDMDKLPDELIDLYKINSSFVDEKIIKLISSNEEKKLELIKIVKNKTIMQFLKKSRVFFHYILENLTYDELNIIINFINDYNYEYDKEKARIKEIQKASGFINGEEYEKLKSMNYVYPSVFLLNCIIVKAEQKVITQENLLNIAKNETNLNNENLKLKKT